MSGVLDRMAKRALGALPTVQPLAVPHFATPATGLGESMPALETNLEIEAPPAPRKTARSAIPQEETLSPEQSPESRRNDDTSGASRTPEPSPQPESTETQHPQTRRQSKGDPNADDEQSLNTGPGRGPHRRGKSLAPSKKDTTQAARIEPEDAEAGTRAPLPEQIEKESPSYQTPEIFVKEFVREREDRPVTSALELRRPAPRSLPARQREAAAPVEQKTEIQISIGSIELRAPRVEARPQAPPFRPRVTLEDFLRRKPEGA